ncbi:MAG: phosphatidylinositol mannoside acyltransferase [Actinomycetota bacterium]
MPINAKRPEGEGRLLQLVYYAYVGCSRLALAIPESWAYRLAGVLGSLVARRSKRRRQVARNLARITARPADSPEVQKLVVEAYRSYARYWLETFRLVREGREFFLERFRATGEENLDGVLARGKGAVVVVGHLGNWDAAGAWVGARGNLLVTVAEVLRPRRMFDFFVAHRARLGMRIHAAQVGVTRTLIKEVNEGAVVAILGDRDLKGTGIEVDFFGAPATLPGGAASIALKTGVPLLVAGVYSELMSDGRRGWMADISAPIELPEDAGPGSIAVLTQQVGEKLEEYIARRPEEWHVFQPFWVEDRAAARKS